MSNTAWQNGRREAGEEDPYLGDLRVAQIDELVAADVAVGSEETGGGVSRAQRQEKKG